MKGHKFDWRKKRQLPYDADSINWATMRRCPFVSGDPLHYWWTKRGNLRFYRYHQRRMFGPDVPMV